MEYLSSEEAARLYEKEIKYLDTLNLYPILKAHNNIHDIEMAIERIYGDNINGKYVLDGVSESELMEYLTKRYTNISFNEETNYFIKFCKK